MFEDHIRCMEEVSARLKKANFSIKILYGELVVLDAFISVNLDKVSAILNYPLPKNVRRVRRLIVMVRWQKDSSGLH